MNFLDFLFGTDKHKFVVRKAYCSPARNILLTTLQPYGIPVSSVSEHIVFADVRVDGRTQKLPAYQECKFYVSKKQANWTEYLLYRSRQFVVMDGFVNRVSNERWAAKHDTMPRPWSTRGGVWVEKSCSMAALKNRA